MSASISPATFAERAALPLLLLFGCGDPLVGADYHGEPLLELAGEVLMEEPLGDDADDLRVAVFWAGPEPDGTDELVVTTTTAFPAQYTLTLYQPPDEDALLDPPFGHGQVAVGAPMLYLDTDDDETWDRDSESVIGGSQGVLILYVTEAQDAERPDEAPTGKPEEGDPPPRLEAGYHTVEQLGETCDHKALTLEEVDPAMISLALGSLWESLVDVNCDGNLDEWTGL